MKNPNIAQQCEEKAKLIDWQNGCRETSNLLRRAAEKIKQLEKENKELEDENSLYG